jgi:hypothetical protein
MVLTSEEEEGGGGGGGEEQEGSCGSFEMTNVSER